MTLCLIRQKKITLQGRQPKIMFLVITEKKFLLTEYLYIKIDKTIWCPIDAQTKKCLIFELSYFWKGVILAPLSKLQTMNKITLYFYFLQILIFMAYTLRIGVGGCFVCIYSIQDFNHGCIRTWLVRIRSIPGENKWKD